VNRFQFVDDHLRQHGVKRLCEVVGVARSSYYRWKATAPERAARAADDARLAARIRMVHRESAGTYGVPRITAELHDTGQVVNHKRVARVMRQVGLAGLRLRRRHRTTVADPTTVKAPDLLERDFTAPKPNARYVGDITYLPIADGTFCYLATVMDLCSRRLVGWAVADHMRVDLVLDALHAAERTRGSLDGVIFHSDHGAQYGARAFAEACRAAGVTRSMGAVGSSADNAAAEASTHPSNAKPSKAPRIGTVQGKHVWRCSAGRTATTPDDATPISARSPRSTTRTACCPHRLR
jgi:transposase InsO family protein